MYRTEAVSFSGSAHAGEHTVRRMLGAVGLLVAVACSKAPTTSGTRLLAGTPQDTVVSEESIPAEWKVAEDTSHSGLVTTASVQLPAAREIEGLIEGDEPELALRCVNGQVTAYIVVAGDETGDSTQSVPIELDEAPACE
jgi:hypothetical protein